jgi:hypothetical protein
MKVEALLCDSCEELSQDEGVMVYSNGGMSEWCDSCVDYSAFFCDECESHHDTNCFGQHDVGGNTICDDCIQHYYTYCDNCDEYERSDNNQRCNRGIIKPWDYKPDFVMHGSGTTQFGIELECEATTRAVPEVASTFDARTDSDDVYLKHDGSLDNGFEIVTHPRDLESWREYAPTLLTDLRILDTLGMRSWTKPTCGLHVHVSKAGMTPSHMVRFGLLFSRNQLDWQSVARRDANTYCTYSDLGTGRIKDKVSHRGNANHFDAVNYANRTTIEVRIFRPSFSLRFLACIELVAGAHEYTKHLTSYDVARGALEWPRFAEFMSRGQYPHAAHAILGENFASVYEVLPCA